MSENNLNARKLLDAPYLKKSPDKEQFAVATSLENTIVAAGAGSGKTQTLATRFAYLIMSEPNTTVDRILTLTFTEKAAAEMYRRIYITLKKFAADLPDSSIEKARAERAVKDFSKARIQTLDSFSMEIVKSAANLYGIRPDFTVGNADSGKQIRDAAFAFILEHRFSPAIQRISEAGKFSKAAAFFAEAADKHTSLADSLDGKCSVFLNSLKVQDEYIRAFWNENGGALVSDIIEGVNNLAETFSKVNMNASEAKTLLQKAIEDWNAAQVLVRKISVLPASAIFAPSDDALKFAALLSAFKVKVGDSKKNAPLKEIIETLWNKKKDGLADKFCAIVSFYEEFETLQELCPLLDDFVESINAQKRKSGALTFTDSSRLALKILCLQGQIRKDLRASFDKIMIDEFQDNNAANRDLLLLISRAEENGGAIEYSEESEFLAALGPIMKNRLFFVGDEKQSIYKFRGADVSVFNSLHGVIGGKILHMPNNYRSDEPLLQGFNQFFREVFPRARENDFEADFPEAAEAVFPPAKKKAADNPAGANAGADNASAGDNAGIDGAGAENDSGADGRRIHACMLNTASLGKNEKAAFLKDKESKIYFIAKKILLGGKPFSDYAVLTKSRTDYQEFARIFSLMGIPYSLDQQKNIFDEAPVNDIYNVLRLSVYPRDSNCYTAFLCSPFCGLALKDAETVLAVQKNAIAFDGDSSEEIKKSLGDSAQRKYFCAKEFYEQIRGEILSEKITRTVSRLWYEYGYRYATELEDLFDLLFELAREADARQKDAAWFVDALAVVRQNSRNKDEDELDAAETDYQTERARGVQIMTIHKSKGLEFPSVFVYGVANTHAGGGSKNEAKIYRTGQFGLSVNIDYRYGNFFRNLDLVQNREEEKEEAEFKRLVYVALTRAINEVFVVGDWSTNRKNKENDKLLYRLFESYYPDNLDSAPFAFEEIPYVQKEAFQEEISSRTPDAKTLKALMEKEKAVYDKKQVRLPKSAPYFYTSPSSLEEKNQAQSAHSPDSAAAAVSDSVALSAAAGARRDEPPASARYPELNAFVNSSALLKNEYGTLFHSFMEKWSRALDEFEEHKISAEEYFSAEPLVRKISSSNKKILLDVFYKILKTFTEAPDNEAVLALKGGREFFAEYEFKTKIHSYIISGTMDAVYENTDGSYTVLDYKTDLTANPSFYYNQLSCYKKATADLFIGGDMSRVRCLLFFAECGKFADITCEAQKAFENLSDEKIKDLIEKSREA